MSRKYENQGFQCIHCGTEVLPLDNGSYRNHCPACLYSVHVDNKPGDRQSQCGGKMRPVGVKNSSHKGMQIIHQCMDCNQIKVNIIAIDGKQSDNLDEIIKLM